MVKEEKMGIKELIGIMIHHISDKIEILSAPGPHSTRDQKLSVYWCGIQTATWASDLIWSAKNDGVIDFDEMTEYERKISDLNYKLQEVGINI